MAKATPAPEEVIVHTDPETNVITVTIGNAKVEVSADGKSVVVYSRKGSVREDAPVAAAAEGEASAHGVVIRKAPEGHLIIRAVKDVTILKKVLREEKPVPAQVGARTREGVYIGRFANKEGEKRDYYADNDDLRRRRGKGKRLTPSFNEAVKYARASRAFDKKDWQLPTGYDDHNGAPDILGALYKIKDKFNNRKDVVGFDESGAGNEGRSYMSSSPSGVSWPPPKSGDIYMKVQRFNDGHQSVSHKRKLSRSHRGLGSYVRLVRSVSAYIS